MHQCSNPDCVARDEIKPPTKLSGTPRTEAGRALRWLVSEVEQHGPASHEVPDSFNDALRFARLAIEAEASGTTTEVAYRNYCDNCDGVGWYEGGVTIQTQCEKCNGTGWEDGKP